MRAASGRGCRSWRLNLLSRRERRGRVAEGPVMLQSRGSAGLPHSGPPALPRWLPHGGPPALARGRPAQHCHSADQPPPRGRSGPGVFLLLGTNSLPPLFSCSPLRPASSAWQLILQMLPPSVQSTGFEGKVKLSELHQGLDS